MYSFKLKTQSNSYNYLRPTIYPNHPIKNEPLIKSDNTNYNFNINYNKNLAPCNSCPKNNLHINHNDFSLDKNLITNNSIENNNSIELSAKNLLQPCPNCDSNNVIGFRVRNENEKYIYYCKPSNFLNHINEDYHFEDITILNKDDKYIILNKNMITNNSSEKLNIEMDSEFYNNIRLPLIFMCKCILKKSKKYFHVNGFIL
jgi:hypothetical protein